MRNVRYVWAAATLFVVAGCGGGSIGPFDSVKDLPSLEQFLKHSLNRFDNPAEFTKVEILKLAPIGNNITRIEFKIDGEYVRDSFIEVNREKILAQAGWNSNDMADAQQRLARLPPADTADLEKKNPAASLQGRFVRCDGRIGDKRSYVGNCTARRSGKNWNFESLAFTDLNRKLHDAPHDLNDVRLPVVPEGGLDVSAMSGQLRIRTAVSEMRVYLNSVATLERTVLDRENLVFQKLKDASATGRVWTMTAPDVEGKMTEWVLEFVDCDQKKDPDAVRALVRNSKNELQRCVYDGTVRRAVVVEPDRFTRPIRNVPQLTLSGQVDGQGLFFVLPHGESPSIRIDRDGATLRFLTATHDSSMAAGSAAPLSKSDADLWEKLLERLKPGTQWSGTVRPLNAQSERVTMTVTDLKPDGSYVRVLVELPSESIAVAVYEGSCRKDQLHGWPILLNVVSTMRSDQTVSSLFDGERQMRTVPLTLTADEKGFVGRRSLDELELHSSKAIETAVDRTARIRSVFSSGSKFKGRISGHRGEDLGDVTLTVAEVRGSGDYVRVMAHATDVPYDVVTYEGRIRNDPAALIDGYCLELSKRTQGWQSSFLLNQNIQPVSLWLRLSADAAHVVGGVMLDRSRVVETLMLTPSPRDPKSPSLATDDFADLIRSKLAKGATWRGQYKWLERGKTADISMRVIDLFEEGIAVEFTSTQLTGGKISYEGLLRLDDVNVNGRFGALQKTVGGKLPAPRPTVRRAVAPPALPQDLVDLFDGTIGRDRSLAFSMNSEGDTLFAVSGVQDRTDLKRAEILVLRPTALPKPVTTTLPPSTAVSTGTTPFANLTPAASTATPPGPARVWTSADGKFTVTAGTVRLIGNNLTLRHTNGQTIDVPLDKLSTADQEHVRKYPPPMN